MVSSKVIFALALVCVALVPAYAAVTKCHQCNSATEPKCLTGNTTSSDCEANGGFTHCVKVITNEDTDKESVVKSCGKEDGYKCASSTKCLFCDENDCNSSIAISTSVPVIGLSAIAAYLLSRFNH